MNVWHYRWLCRFSYIDLPQQGTGMRGRQLGEAARQLLEAGGLSAEEREALQVICRTQTLRELVLLDYMNRNAGSGFVGYAFASPEGVECIFRGSEAGSIDWADNFLAPLFGSVQYADAEEFAARFKGQSITFSGHSKGAHNALYALAVSGGEACRALTFNGQGFAPGQLTRTQRRRLGRLGVNYVVCGDVVGLLLQHPEKRFFVRRAEGQDAHALAAFSFDGEGRPVRCTPPLRAIMPQWASRIYERLLFGRMNYGNVANRIASAPHS